MGKRRISIPLAFGINQSQDAKIAPFGYLKNATNLRIKQRGQLGVRNGFSPLVMSSGSATMVAYDLFAYKNRLCAMGDDQGNGYPTEIFEYINQAQAAWKSSDPEKARVMLNPFTNLRDVAGMPQANASIEQVDAAVGQGRICVVYKINTFAIFAVILDQETDQVLYAENLYPLLNDSSGDFKVVHSNNRFYIALKINGGLRVYRYTTLSSTSWTTHISNVSGATVSAWDMGVIATPTTGELVFAYDNAAISNLGIKVYDTSGVQVGSTITLAATDSEHISIESDQTDNTINLHTIENTDDGTLRTYNYAGTLLDGPTLTQTGLSSSICRLRAMGSLPDAVAIMTNNLTGDEAVLEIYNQDTHAQIGADRRIQNATMRSRLMAAQTPGQPIGVVWAGLVAPNLPDALQATNFIAYSSPTVHHTSKRDYIKAMDLGFLGNITRDSTTGKLCWPAAMDPGIDDNAVPSVCLLDFQSSDRRQGVQFGQHYYLSGGTPSVYDGRVNVDLGFNESPGIREITQDNNVNDHLVVGATYHYAVHWEYVTADKSVMVSPVSVGGNPGQAYTDSPSVTITAGNTGADISCNAPHHILQAVGDVAYGGTLIAVLSRTVWDASSGVPQSIFRRCQIRAINSTISAYGQDISFSDGMSDAELATQAPIYTQGERGILSGPLEQNGPQPCSYITASESRLILGGLIRSSDFQISRAAFRGETYSFSEFSQFFNQVDESIIGVQALDGAKVIYTANDIFAFAGDGPDDLGGGVVSDPSEISSQGGLIEDGWKSFLNNEKGLFYQHSRNRLMILPRGAQSPDNIGEPVQDTLDAFPQITGATRIKNDFVACFSCNNDDGDDARLLTIDFHQDQWLLDSLPLEDDAGIDCIVEYQSKLAYLSGGVVYFQRDDFADNGTDFIPTSLETNVIYPFGLGGKGLIYDIVYVGVKKSDSILTLSVSYNDGLSYTPMTASTQTGTNGSTIKTKYTTAQQLYSSVAFKLDVSGVTPGEGMIHNHIEVWVEDEWGPEELDPINNLSNA